MDDPPCPRCRTSLVIDENAGEEWTCPSCRGHTRTVQAVADIIGPPLRNRIWSGAGPVVGPCPSCTAPMRHARVSFGFEFLEVEVCGGCYRLWLEEVDYARIFEENRRALVDLDADELLAIERSRTQGRLLHMKYAAEEGYRSGVVGGADLALAVWLRRWWRNRKAQ